MSQRRLYCPQFAIGEVVLTGEEAHHAVDVLRLRRGDAVALFDGLGAQGVGTVEHSGRGQLRVQVSAVEVLPLELAIELTIAVAMPRAHRQAYLVEKCTELGVAAIWPMVTARSTAKPDVAAVAKWTRRAIEAAKQSQRSRIPEIAVPSTLAEVLKRIQGFSAKGIFVPDGNARDVIEFLDDSTASAPSKSSTGASAAGSAVTRILALVGPEGGWTHDECELANSAGFQPIRLGPTVLRTETAAVALCAVVSVWQGHTAG